MRCRRRGAARREDMVDLAGEAAKPSILHQPSGGAVAMASMPIFGSLHKAGEKVLQEECPSEQHHRRRRAATTAQ